MYFDIGPGSLAEYVASNYGNEPWQGSNVVEPATVAPVPAAPPVIHSKGLGELDDWKYQTEKDIMGRKEHEQVVDFAVSQLLERGINDEATLQAVADRLYADGLTSWDALREVNWHSNPLGEVFHGATTGQSANIQDAIQQRYTTAGGKRLPIPENALALEGNRDLRDQLLARRGGQPYGGMLETAWDVGKSLTEGGDWRQGLNQLGKSIGQNWPTLMLPAPMSFLPAIAGAMANIVGSFTDEFGRGMNLHADGTVSPQTYEQSWGYDPASADPGGNDASGDLFQMLTNPTVSVAAGSPFNRQTALDELIAGTQTGTVNPGIADQYFNNIIKTGILRRNEALGGDVTQQGFETEFGSSRLGEELLGQESSRLRDVATGQIGGVFTGKAFEPITDDAAVSNILSEQRSTALGDIARFGSRGNLSATGGATAGQFIAGKEPAARSRLEEIGSSVRGLGQRDVDVIRGRAEQLAAGFNLGDEFFDIAPFTAERESLIRERTPGLEQGIRTQLGAERLFDPQAAISEAAGTQGLVSGAPTFLDEIAARGGSAIRRDRGIGTIGSGVF